MRLAGNFSVLAIIISFTILSGCSFYSFTGASIPPNAQSVSIAFFQNKAKLIEPTLSQTITDGLRDKFSSQTSLDVINEEGDLHLEGFISDYNTKPQAIQGDQTAALNRLTITVKVTYINSMDDSKSFKDASFSRYEDYSAEKSLEEVKDELIVSITEVIIDDIFNRAVVNW